VGDQRVYWHAGGAPRARDLRRPSQLLGPSRALALADAGAVEVQAVEEAGEGRDLKGTPAKQNHSAWLQHWLGCRCGTPTAGHLRWPELLLGSAKRRLLNASHSAAKTAPQEEDRNAVGCEGSPLQRSGEPSQGHPALSASVLLQMCAELQTSLKVPRFCAFHVHPQQATNAAPANACNNWHRWTHSFEN